MHRAAGGSQSGTTGVFKCLARLEQRLLPHHTQALNVLAKATGVHNRPVPSNQLCSNVADIGQGHGISKGMHRLTAIGFFRQVLRLYKAGKFIAGHNGQSKRDKKRVF